MICLYRSYNDPFKWDTWGVGACMGHMHSITTSAEECVCYVAELLNSTPECQHQVQHRATLDFIISSSFIIIPVWKQEECKDAPHEIIIGIDNNTTRDNFRLLCTL